MQYQVDLTDQTPENGKKLFFGLLDHSKMPFCDLWMILHDQVILPNVGKHLVLSQYAISSRSNRPNSRKWPKTSFLAFWIIKKCIFVIFEWSFMTCSCCTKLEDFCYYHNMQYQVDPTDQSPENGQKPLFWLFGSFKNAFLWHLNDPSWPGNVAECWNSFSTILMCNIKSIQQTKHQKMAKKHFFGTSDHSKMLFCDCWMIQHEQYRGQIVETI